MFEKNIMLQFEMMSRDSVITTIIIIVFGYFIVQILPEFWPISDIHQHECSVILNMFSDSYG
jgi:hypothetical protein